MRRTVGLTVLLAAGLWLVVPAGFASTAGDKACCPCPEDSDQEHKAVSSRDMERMPETVVLDMKGDIYGPVEFTHLDHTDYAEQGCTQCHHQQAPSEPLKPCGACHERKTFREPDKLNVPGLQGAYHRQCVGCHVDYGSGPTECAECHEIKRKPPVTAE